jgi:hypothetical protein
MNAHGRLTSETAQAITIEMNKRGFDVYYDHGDPSNPFVGTIPVSTEEELTSKNQISQLDIVVVERDINKNKAIALIEIEETTDTPKTLIGDIFTTLMGDSVHLPGRRNKAKVGNWTTLIIIGKDAGHEDRNDRICNLANKAKSALGTGNSKIGNIVIEAFSENKLLKDVLMEKIDKAIQRSA